MGLEYFGGPRILNGLTGATQTFAVGSSGTDFGVTSSAGTHTFNIPDASATARGLVTTGTQTIAGAKKLTGLLTVTGSNSTNPITVGTAVKTSFAMHINSDSGGSLYCYDTSGNISTVSGDGAVTQNSVGFFGFASGTSATVNSDARISRSGTGVLQVGTTANNALGSMNLTNMTASGAITGATMSIATALQIANNASLIWQQGGSGTKQIEINSGIGTVLRWSTTTLLLNSAEATVNSLLSVRNGTTAQAFQVYGTYTSGTTLELMQMRGVAAANFEIGVMKGSVGGTLRGLTIGSYANESAAITPWLTFDNAGAITVAARLGLAGAPNANTVFHSQSTVTRQFLFNRTEIGTANTDGTYFSVDSGGQFTIWNQETSGGAIRFGAGDLEVLKLNTNKSCVATGQIVHVPPSSVTLTTNGQYSVEMTSDTAGNLVYRGSDGTTRRCALTFV